MITNNDAPSILLNDSHKCNEKRKTQLLTKKQDIPLPLYTPSIRQPQMQREKKTQLLTKKQDIPVPLYTPRIRQTTALLSWDVL